MAGVHEDFGEKIGGAKKDLWKDRGLYADDLEAMNEREAEKFVKKDNVWKKPDYAAMLEEGIPLGVVYFIKKARDGLNASPQYYRTDDTPEKRTARQKEYIKTVRELQTVLSDVRTVEDAIRAYVRNSNLCTTHAISYEALQQIVMSDIQKHIKNMEALGDQFIQEMHELSEKGGSKKIKQFEKDLEVAEKRIAEIDSVIMKLFEQNALGKISDERFEKMSSAYESEQKELAQKRDELRTKIRAEEKKTQSTNQFLETIRKYETVTELNRSMLVELIDSIYVYQAEGTGKDRKQRVEINYRFLAGSQCGIA